jgi:hypothetical protein
MDPLKPSRAGDTLPTDFAHFADDAKDDGGQSPLSAGMIVFTWAVLQSGSPKGRRIDHNRSIAFMAMHLPVRQSFDLSLPEPQHRRGLPGATPESRPSQPNSRVRQTTGF